MTEKLIISIIALLMFAFTLKKGGKREISLAAGLTVGILITWINVSTVQTVGLILYMLSGLAVFILNLKKKDLSTLNWAAILTAGLFTFVANFFALMHLPYADFIRLGAIIPLAMYVISLFNGMTKRKEMGYMTIMNVQFVMGVIGLL